ncbi:MAG: carboxypeptidase-like regulatory domain-containing protein, partial [Ekhidna sp.]|nr:carboxypeptidase-like regulatory domain-containing protein [Ekhidna sp.]
MKNLNISVFALTIICLAMSLTCVGQLPDFQAKDEPVASIISRLKQLSDFQFVYNQEEIDKCPSATFSLKNSTVEEILEKSLANCVLTFKKVDNTIVITPRAVSIDKGLHQVIRGKIIDADTKLPLIGATVLVAESDPPLGAISDIDGNFRINKVPIGRVNLRLSYIGYESKIVPNVLVHSAKETVMNLELRESITSMDEIVVTTEMEKGVPANDMVLVSGRSISPEESNRFAGPFNDPTRIMSNFAGVAATQDGSNDIIVRGNSPKYIQWRLEGVQITNPNHFANQNAIGSGGISALNNNLLEKSDFYSGAFSAEYGDVLSGVYDVRLRSGNNEKFEGIFGLGIMGTDVTLEGPLKKGYDGSFLVNYRYSTVSLIADLGIVDVTGIPRYQDAAFKVTLPTKKMGNLSLFGLWGLSGFDLVDLSEEGVPGHNPLTSDLLQDHKTKSSLLNLGLTHTYYLNDHSSILTALSASNEGIDDEVIANLFEVDEDNQPIRDSPLSNSLFYDSRIKSSAYRASITYSSKVNSKNKLQVGSNYAILGFDYDQSLLNDPSSSRSTLARFDENISTFRNFVNWKYRPTGNLIVVAGVHNMNVLFNNKSTLEPRVSAIWSLG